MKFIVDKHIKEREMKFLIDEKHEKNLLHYEKKKKRRLMH